MKSAAAKISAGVIAGATVFIVAWEGNKTKPYLDGGGVPTVCAGVTHGIDFARIYTAEECAAMNAEQIRQHAAQVLACVTREISDDEKIALVSIAYNAGAGPICRSTLMRKLNAGQPYCDEYLRWNKDGGREVRGLTNRRTAERALCKRGANENA